MEKEYKNYKLKKNINPTLKIACICVVVFLGIMWTSFLWLPQNKEEFQVTQLNVPMEESTTNRVLTMIRWDYSEYDELMEIQFKIENNNFDGKDAYVWSAVDRYQGSLSVDKIYEDTEILVVQIKNVPSNWSIISLRMTLQGHNPDTEFMFKMYGDDTNVAKVNSLKTLDKNGYYILDIQNSIALYEMKIEDLKAENIECQAKIKEISKSIEGRMEKLQYMTEKEKDVALEEINSLQALTESHGKTIEDNLSEIQEYEQRISNLNAKVDHINKGSDI